MKNLFNKSLAVVALGAVFTACEDNSDVIRKVEVLDGVYVLNTGNWGANNGSLQMYDPATKEVSDDIFAENNQVGLGDLAQDLCVYGSKIYVTVSGSAKLEIMDKKGKSLKTILLKNESGVPVEPRYLAAANGNIYFSAYDGNIHRLDTVALEVNAKTAVGHHPEGITVSNNKLFVNNSDYMMDGSGNSVSVINLGTFKEERKIEVVRNPYNMSKTAENGMVYIVSCGDYGKTIPSTLQQINPSTYEVKELGTASVFDLKGSQAYTIYADYYVTGPKEFKIFDLESGKVSNNAFVSETNFSNPQTIQVDPLNGDLYISDQPWGELGTMYRYDASFSQVDKFETGYATAGIFFNTKTIEETID